MCLFLASRFLVSVLELCIVAVGTRIIRARVSHARQHLHVGVSRKKSGAAVFNKFMLSAGQYLLKKTGRASRIITGKGGCLYQKLTLLLNVIEPDICRTKMKFTVSTIDIFYIKEKEDKTLQDIAKLQSNSMSE